MGTFKSEARPIAALPGFGTAKHGKWWFLVELVDGDQLGGAHNTKLEAIAYGYHRYESYFGVTP